MSGGSLCDVTSLACPGRSVKSPKRVTDYVGVTNQARSGDRYPVGCAVVLPPQYNHMPGRFVKSTDLYVNRLKPRELYLSQLCGNSDIPHSPPHVRRASLHQDPRIVKSGILA